MSGRGESGAVSLVEVVVCVSLLALLGVVVFPLVASFSQESASIQSTYNAVDQLIEPTQILATYLHEAVAPAPVGSATATWSVFTANSGANEVQFAADVGTYGQTSDAGHFTVYGPALVTVTTGTGTDGKRDLVGTLQPANTGTCPGVTSGTGCTWGTSRPLFTVPDLTDGTGASPVFSYLESGDVTTSSPSTSCSAPPGTCPLDSILAVQYTVDTQNATALPGGDQSEAFLLAPSYSAAVG